eukprot:7387956-Prymnesium_polylepis.2
MGAIRVRTLGSVVRAENALALLQIPRALRCHGRGPTPTPLPRCSPGIWGGCVALSNVMQGTPLCGVGNRVAGDRRIADGPARPQPCEGVITHE